MHAFLCAAARGAAYPALFFDAIRRDLLRSRKICRAPSVIISLILKLREGVHEDAGEPQGDNLYIYLSGELDEHSVASASAEADRCIDENAGLSRAVFNLAGVKFMDSTGIGYLMGRYKRLKAYGMRMYLEDPDPGADKILALSGVYSLMPKL